MALRGLLPNVAPMAQVHGDGEVVATRSVTRSEKLPPDAASARRARRLVAEVLDGAGLEDLEDLALLLVSETVTNAVIHAATDIELLVVAEGGCLRVEVSDGSPVLPGVRHYDEEATTGRGVGLVEVLATAWGFERTTGGKTVWFTLGEGAERDASEVPEVDAPLGFTVRLLSLPAHLVRAALQHGDAVLREVALSALSGQPLDELPEWHGTTIDLSPVLDPVERSLADGRTSLDLEAVFPAGADAGARDRRALVDLVERLAAEGRFPMVRALPEIAHVRGWLLGEIRDQAGGAAPVPWEPSDDLGSSEAWVFLSDDERAQLRDLPGPVVVADETNHIVHLDEAAVALLGWEVEELVGRRLTTIIPPALRDAHLAAFTRYQLTRTPVIIGSSIEVPALRRDGTTVQVWLLIEPYTSADGRRGFKALLDPV